jgi:hypothetical protein
MARREVIEVTCDRCGRTETQSVDDKGSAEAEVTVTFHGETYSYDDLCKRCRNAVKGYFDRIAKKTEDQPEADPKVTSIDPASETSERKRFFGGG